MRSEKYKHGERYEVGDTLEFGVIKAIWDHPKNKGRLVFMVLNKGKLTNTCTFYEIQKRHIVGPTLYRFVPYAILKEANSLLFGDVPTIVEKKKVMPVMETKETAARKRPVPMLKKKQTIPPIGSVVMKRKAKGKDG